MKDSLTRALLSSQFTIGKEKIALNESIKKVETEVLNEAESIDKNVAKEDNAKIEKGINKTKLKETAYEKDLDHNKPIRVEGVYGAKSRPFSKKFKNMSHYEKWADSDQNSGNFDAHRVYNEETQLTKFLKLKEEQKIFEEEVLNIVNELVHEGYDFDVALTTILEDEEILSEISAKTLMSYKDKSAHHRAEMEKERSKIRKTKDAISSVKHDAPYLGTHYGKSPDRIIDQEANKKLNDVEDKLNAADKKLNDRLWQRQKGEMYAGLKLSKLLSPNKKNFIKVGASIDKKGDEKPKKPGNWGGDERIREDIINENYENLQHVIHGAMSANSGGQLKHAKEFLQEPQHKDAFNKAENYLKTLKLSKEKLHQMGQEIDDGGDKFEGKKIHSHVLNAVGKMY